MASCASLEMKNLDQDSREFLSKVRFLITRQEKKIFLSLPLEERENFIEEFWAKRDPDPYTEINEFKVEYFNRIETANQFFRGGQTPGWLQDRGRIYIVLGPPDQRLTYPYGYTFYDIPSEVWIYGYFPIVFIDDSWNNNYKLSLASARQVALLQRAQAEWNPQVAKKKTLFDYGIEVLITEEGGKIQIQIPYKNIWMTEMEDRLEARLKISVDIRTEDGKDTVWKAQKDYDIFLSESKLLSLDKQEYLAEIPFYLSKGEYRLHILVENVASKEKNSKIIKFSL